MSPIDIVIFQRVVYLVRSILVSVFYVEGYIEFFRSTSNRFILGADSNAKRTDDTNLTTTKEKELFKATNTNVKPYQQGKPTY